MVITNQKIILYYRDSRSGTSAVVYSTRAVAQEKKNSTVECINPVYRPPANNLTRSCEADDLSRSPPQLPPCPSGPAHHGSMAPFNSELQPLTPVMASHTHSSWPASSSTSRAITSYQQWRGDALSKQPPCCNLNRASAASSFIQKNRSRC